MKTTHSYYQKTSTWLGVLLGFGMPTGAIIYRFVIVGNLSVDWMHSDLIEHVNFYLYMIISAPVVFGLFGSYLGLLHDKIRLHEQSLESLNEFLRGQSMTDDITGLYNHRHILVEIEREVERARRYHHLLSGMMIDIDDFKKVNDTHGHLAGDRVLKETARIIAESIRKIDVLGRYGGDEFIVILPESDAAGAQLVAERIQRNIRQHCFDSDNLRLSVTVSIGAFFFQDLVHIEQNIFIEKADQALLQAKAIGKDRIYFG